MGDTGCIASKWRPQFLTPFSSQYKEIWNDICTWDNFLVHLTDIINEEKLCCRFIDRDSLKYFLTDIQEFGVNC